MKTKTLTLTLLFSLSLFAATYTTYDILEFVEKPTSLPDFTVKANARGGYGTPQMFDSKPQADVHASLLLQMDILSTSEIRARKDKRDQRKALVLSELSSILSHESSISFLEKQRSAYHDRRLILQERIKLGFSEQTEIFPIERYLIDLETKIQQERDAVRQCQLKISGLASDHWYDLFEAVKQWDRKL